MARYPNLESAMYATQSIQLCDDILKEGVTELSMAHSVYLAIVSHIVDDLYEIASVRSATKVFVPGESFPLDDTLCRDIFAKGITIALSHIAREPGQSLYPLYENMDIEAVIGTPIYKRGEIWGTLNFTNPKIKRGPFKEREITFIENAARRLSDALSSS